MNSTIEDLYLSQMYNDIIDPKKYLESISPLYKERLQKNADIESNFYKNLDDKLKKQYDNLCNINIELSDLEMAHAFSTGFNLAIKIMTEALATKVNESI